MTAGDRSSGFTLVELLVAATLLALLSAALFGGLRFGARAWESGGDRIERAGEVEAAQELLRRTLVETAAAEGASAGLQDDLLGAPDSLDFFAPLPKHAGLGGIGRYRLALDEKGRLALAWEPRRPERRFSDTFPAEPATVLDGVEGMTIAYYGAEQPGEAPAWRDHWSGRSLPLLIRIELAFGADDPRTWPELVIAPRLARAAEG